MLKDIKEFKESVKSNLELNFIEKKDRVEKEMKMLNILISTFKDSSEYTYDEYCRDRMRFELEACDTLDTDFEMNSELTDEEQMEINIRVKKKLMGGRMNLNIMRDPEEVLKNEFIKMQVDKISDFEKKSYHHIIKSSSMEMLKKKLGSLFDDKRDYFEGICDSRAKRHADATAYNNKEHYEEVIRNSLH